MYYSLIVVDMQSNFYACQKSKAYVAKAIKKAIRDKAAILFVEYKGYPATLSELTDLVKNYKRVATVYKRAPGGGVEVKNSLRRLGFPKRNLKVCGVNTDQCVLETVKGVHRLMPFTKLHILEKGCATASDFTDHPTYHQVGLKQMAELSKRVKVVK